MGNKKREGFKIIEVMMALTIIFAVLFVAPLLFAGGSTVSISGSVTVPNNCLFATDNSAITFGGASGVQTGTNTLTANVIKVTDGGNYATNILVSGTDWTWASSSVSNTFYANTLNVGITDPRVARLSGASVDTKIPVNLISANAIYFGVNVPTGTSPGTYTQTISIISSC